MGLSSEELRRLRKPKARKKRIDWDMVYVWVVAGLLVLLCDYFDHCKGSLKKEG